MATRAEWLPKLAAEYRRVLDGIGDEVAFGQRLERFNLSPSEMTAVSRMARGVGRETDLAAEDVTRGGERLARPY